METAMKKVDNQTRGMNPGLVIDPGAVNFSDNERYILFSLKRADLPKPTEDIVPVDIWNYQDTTLQSDQLYNLESVQKYSVLIGVDDKTIVPLEKNDQAFVIMGDDNAIVKNSIENDERPLD